MAGKNNTPLAARLRKKITIQQLTETQDAEGGLVESWATYAIRSASIVPLNGTEYFQSRQFQNDVNYRIRLRYDSITKDITPKMRISWDSKIFDIESIINPMERNKELVLMCIERI